MTIEALYKKIIASDELKAAFAEAVKAQKLDEFLKAQGLRGHRGRGRRLPQVPAEGRGASSADDELSAVAGGCNSTEAIYSMTVAFCIGFAIMSAVDPVSENKDDWGDKLLCDI